jgi:hypothetical protein
MRPFLRAFNTGFMGLDARQIDTGWGIVQATKGESYVLQSKSSKCEEIPNGCKANPRFRSDLADTFAHAEFDSETVGHGDSKAKISDGSEKIIIRRTDVWNVSYGNHKP